jgi:dethiobiotin synthase
MSARYWKPIQTGMGRDDDSGEVRRLSGCDADDVVTEGVRLRHPVSPHLAARLEGTLIDLDAIFRIAAAASDRVRWIVEGAGGVLVPVNARQLMIDLIGRLGLPAVVVSRSGLGTINHTLLTIEALGRREVSVAGVVMVGPPDAENRAAIERYGGVRVLGELPILDPLGPGTLGRWADQALDRDGKLTALFA